MKLALRIGLVALALIASSRLFAVNESTCEGYLDLAPDIPQEEGEILVHLLNERLINSGFEPGELQFEFLKLDIPDTLVQRHLKPHDWLLLIEEANKGRFKHRTEGTIQILGTKSSQSGNAARATQGFLDHDWFTYVVGYVRSTGRRALVMNRLQQMPSVKTSEKGEMVRVNNVLKLPQILIFPVGETYLDRYIDMDDLEIFSSTAHHDWNGELESAGIRFIGANTLVPTPSTNPQKPMSDRLIESAKQFSQGALTETDLSEDSVLAPSDSDDTPPTLH